MGILKSLVRVKIKTASKACCVLLECTKIERWAKVAGDQMEESLVMGRVGLYSENDPSE